MSLRLSLTAAAAVLLAALSLTSVLRGGGWLLAGTGAVLVVAAAGMAARLPAARRAPVATLLVLAAVVPLLSAPSWALRGTGLLIAALVAAGATGARLPRGLSGLACYLAALLLYLNLVFAGGRSLAHLIPSDGSVSLLGQQWQAALAGFRSVPPISDTRAVSLVAAGGIGLIAVAVDAVAVGQRRPAVAGLPLLVLFSVPIASSLQHFGALQVVTFAAAMAGFLALLSAASRDRLRLWGRLVTWRFAQQSDQARAGPDTRELAATGRRIGLAAICLAVLLPLALPAMHSHDIFASTGAQGGTGAGGSGGVAAGDALFGLQQDLTQSRPRPVLTYRTSAANPAQQYFQVAVLSYSASQDAWLPVIPANFASEQQVTGPRLPYPPQGRAAGTPAARVTTSVTIDSDQVLSDSTTLLPAPYAPVRLTAGMPGWVELPGSLMLLFNPGLPLAGLHYTVTSAEADPTPADILASSAAAVPAGVRSQFGSYGGPDAARLTAIARQQTKGAATSLQQALDLQSWFTSGAFTYTLRPGLPASHWLLTFLTTRRRGYCQQFAWAFAVLARTLGIPARVVIGYTAGTPSSDGSWQVTTADAHAWPELYFPGQGWLRFEPTPNGVPGQGTASVPGYATGLAGSPAQSPVASQSAAASAQAGASAGSTAATSRLLHDQAGGPGGQATQSAGGWLILWIPAVILAALAAPALTRQLTRRRRRLTGPGDRRQAHAAWRELADDLTDFGLAGLPGETPRALAARIRGLGCLDPAAAAALGRIAQAEERARYARQPEASRRLAADVAAVRRGLAAAAPLRRRLQARLMPVSTLTAAARLLQRAGDMLGWLDASWPVTARRRRPKPRGRSLATGRLPGADATAPRAAP